MPGIRGEPYMESVVRSQEQASLALAHHCGWLCGALDAEFRTYAPTEGQDPRTA